VAPASSNAVPGSGRHWFCPIDWSPESASMDENVECQTV
jgi:hypothetical protein